MRIARAAIGIGIGMAAALLLAAAPAAADNGPHVAAINSGASGIDADSCAGCHRAHTAQGSPLLAAADEVALCLVCHGPSGAGATTDVSDGTLAATTQGLRGGGFTHATMDTAWTGTAVSRPATSAHLYDGTTLSTMWGNGAIDSGPGKADSTLTCVDCHNPHGSGTYRILRPVPTGSEASTGVAIPDQSPIVYTVQSAQNRYFGEAYGCRDLLFGFGCPSGQDTGIMYGMTAWCAQCHTRYGASNAGSGHTDSGDSIYAYRHYTDPSATGDSIDCLLCHTNPDDSAPNPAGITGGSTAHEPVCQNCHVAHGSAAQMGTYSGTVPWPNGATTPSGNGRSSLLRVDNRGVCQGCHDPTK